MARMQNDHTLMAYHKLKARIRYDAVSQTTYNTGDFKPEERKSLILPVQGNPKSTALARSWADTFDNPAKIVNKALEFFSQNDFVYSLNPPGLKEDAIDDDQVVISPPPYKTGPDSRSRISEDRQDSFGNR